MVDIPPPPSDNGGGDGRAEEERLLLAERSPVPDLAPEKLRYAKAVIGIKIAFVAGLRTICYLLPWVAFGMLMVWLDHVIGPQSTRWLLPEEVSHLQALLFSGAISALATALATKHV